MTKGRCFGMHMAIDVENFPAYMINVDPKCGVKVDLEVYFFADLVKVQGFPIKKEWPFYKKKFLQALNTRWWWSHDGFLV